MKLRIALSAAAVVALTVGIVMPLRSEDKTTGAGTRNEKDVPEWMRPGAEHDVLGARAGTYDVQVHCLASAQGPESDSKGVADLEVIMDGRFVKQSFEGEFNGQKFKGLKICGYDRVTGKYSSFWCDSLSTVSMYLIGEGKNDGKIVEFKGQSIDPESKKVLHTRSVLKEKSPDEFTLEMYCDKEGSEKKTMEMTYKRRKP